MYKTQNLEKLMVDKVREKHARHKKNAIAFWKEKIVDCSGWAIRWTSFT